MRLLLFILLLLLPGCVKTVAIVDPVASHRRIDYEHIITDVPNDIAMPPLSQYYDYRYLGDGYLDPKRIYVSDVKDYLVYLDRYYDDLVHYYDMKDELLLVDRRIGLSDELLREFGVKPETHSSAQIQTVVRRQPKCVFKDMRIPKRPKPPRIGADASASIVDTYIDYAERMDVYIDVLVGYIKDVAEGSVVGCSQ